mmetsp:Transcript_43979/g.102783  ORF Transcript_43979/g.102783 Transcript_43979/m.102783 type:complete len:202 (+) Transcript_43979:130-735(+)
MRHQHRKTDGGTTVLEAGASPGDLADGTARVSPFSSLPRQHQVAEGEMKGVKTPTARRKRKNTLSSGPAGRGLHHVDHARTVARADLHGEAGRASQLGEKDALVRHEMISAGMTGEMIVGKTDGMDAVTIVAGTTAGIVAGGTRMRITGRMTDIRRKRGRARCHGRSKRPCQRQKPHQREAKAKVGKENAKESQERRPESL